ncbi:anthranilate phosphoribosyltransferase [Cuniculiplasma sp. SKW4]|uniref:anthranilate phosphoribosyltransferase n=1 Tax=Cuniculiplasma sp. SKW4 TaxID=3400171 RepID=UPI003FD329EB
MIDDFLSKIMEGKDLNKEEAKIIAKELTEGNYTNIVKGVYLTSMYLKGYSPEEIRGFADGLMSFSPIKEYRDCSDIVGTGGDHKGTINVSTAASIVCSSLGIKIGKHGNRGITGKSGGADFMEMSGYKFPKTQEEIIDELSRNNFSFLLAPIHNAAFMKFGEIRKILKHPTIFNLMGPMTNPLRPKIRVIGCTEEKIQDIYAKSMQVSGDRGFVVRSEDGMDEISYSGKSFLMMVNKEVRMSELNAHDIIGKRISDDETTGRDREEIFQKTMGGLTGRFEGASSFIALNAAPCIMANGMENTIEDSYKLAMKAIFSGRVLKKLQEVTGGKVMEVPDAN